MTDISPVFFADEDGQVTIEWPDGRPEWVRVCPEVLEELIGQVNELRRLKGWS